MNAQKVSILSTILNVFLGASKATFGVLTGSVALVADGIHSSLDVFSSFITFLGLRIAKKPIDEKHPYGYFKAESLAGFFVAFLLAVSGIWIGYESVMRFFGEGVAELTIGAVIVVVVSILVTEGLARLKFHYGAKENSIALVADAEHSRADTLSSIGVLVGIFLIRYFNFADAIIALAIGVYILFEAFKVGKEVTDSLLDVADKEAEQKIRKLAVEQKVEIVSLKSRKIGSFTFADLKIKLAPGLKVEEVQKITNNLENLLIEKISQLKEVAIAIEAYDVSQTSVRPSFGRRMRRFGQEIGPKKQGTRTIIPIDNKGKVAQYFGVKRYLLIDKKSSQIVRKEVVKNPYFEKDGPRGARFAKSVKADRIKTSQISDNARSSLESSGIVVEKVKQGADPETLI